MGRLVSTLETLRPTLVNGSWTLPTRLEISSWTCSERLVRKPPCCSEPASQKTLSSAYLDVQLFGKRIVYGCYLHGLVSSHCVFSRDAFVLSASLRLLLWCP